jgi:hypothetical protein
LPSCQIPIVNMIARSTSVSAINAMSDDAFVASAWTILTNVRQCGGGSVKGRKVAQRRLRAMGAKFYLAINDSLDQGRWTEWGFVLPGEPLPQAAEGSLVTGVTINACAAKLGHGCAKRGWEIYFNGRVMSDALAL